jgi:hypothetical protein
VLITSLSLSPMRLLSPLSPMWLLKGLRRSEGQLHRYTPSCYKISDLIQTDLLPQSRLDQRSRGHHHSPYVYEYYEVLPLVALSCCAGVVALESWRQDLHDLEVSYVNFIINACAEAESLPSVYKGMSLNPN